MKRRTLVWLALGMIGFACQIAAGQSSHSTDDIVITDFAILIGFPAADQPESGRVLLVPGTLIPLQGDGSDSTASSKAALDKSLAFTRAVDKLWNTFRLDPSRQLQKGKHTEARVGEPIPLPEIENANVKITATLTGSTSTVATYRVQFKQGDKILADSTAPVTRGGRAVVGGTDGVQAPYIFVFIEAEVPEEGRPGIIRPSKNRDITEPVAVKQVPPQYPEEARKNGISGVVVLDLTIDANGNVGEVIPVEYADKSLTASAIEAVKQWSFSPARNSRGEAIKVRISITINFRLK